MRHRYLIPALAVFCLQLWFTGAGHAQVISVSSNDQEIEAVRVEAEVRRLLRAEGYEVRGGASDGYHVQLSVMYAGGRVVGHAQVTAPEWEYYSVALTGLPSCMDNYILVGRVKELIGVQKLVVAARMYRARTEQELAVLIAEEVGKSIRATSRQVQVFLDGYREIARKMEQSKIETNVNVGEQVH